MKVVKEKIKELAEIVFDDVKIVRESGTEPKDRIGAEIMALNAICNAERTLKEKSADK